MKSDKSQLQQLKKIGKWILTTVIHSNTDGIATV